MYTVHSIQNSKSCRGTEAFAHALRINSVYHDLPPGPICFENDRFSPVVWLGTSEHSIDHDLNIRSKWRKEYGAEMNYISMILSISIDLIKTSD